MRTLLDSGADITIGQIVANNFRSADVFKKYKIDFCCKGGSSLKDICSEKNLDFDLIRNELEQKMMAGPSSFEPRYQDIPVDVLFRHIEQRHHAYIREHIPLILEYLNKVNKVHGRNHPELNEVMMQFINCSQELKHHMVEEESILFPAINKLAECEREGETLNRAFFFGTLSGIVGTMRNEHIIEGHRASRIAELTNNFTPPADACATFKVLYYKLEEFTNDLFTHIHLENNILFPKAIELERLYVHPSCKI